MTSEYNTVNTYFYYLIKMGLKEVGGLTFVLQLRNFIHPASNVQMKKIYSI